MSVDNSADWKTEFLDGFNEPSIAKCAKWQCPGRSNF